MCHFHMVSMASWGRQSVKGNGQNKDSLFLSVSAKGMTKCTRHQPISLIPFLIHSKITVKEWGCHWFHSCFILSNIFILITPRLTFISSSQPEQGLSDFYWHFVAPQTPKMIYVKYYIHPFKVKINLRKFCRIVCLMPSETFAISNSQPKK